MNLDFQTGHEGDVDDANGSPHLDLTESIRSFAGSSGDYYAAQFTKIQSSRKLTWSFNWVGVLLGPIWAGGRGLVGALLLSGHCRASGAGTDVPGVME